jgi:hypothetical protein
VPCPFDVTYGRADQGLAIWPWWGGVGDLSGSAGVTLGERLAIWDRAIPVHSHLPPVFGLSSRKIAAGSAIEHGLTRHGRLQLTGTQPQGLIQILIDALIHDAHILKHRRLGQAAFPIISSTGAKL